MLLVQPLKKYTTLTNSHIGQLFGNISYSAVTRVVQRFEQKIKKDKDLKNRIESIKADLSNLNQHDKLCGGWLMEGKAPVGCQQGG